MRGRVVKRGGGLSLGVLALLKTVCMDMVSPFVNEWGQRWSRITRQRYRAELHRDHSRSRPVVWSSTEGDGLGLN